MPKNKQKIAVIDCETDPFAWQEEVEPFVWGFYDGTIYREFWGEENFCSELLIEYLQDEDYLIYAHNGGKFDYFFLLEYFDPSLHIINGRISKASLNANEFRDSYLILPFPLAAFKKDEFNYKKMRYDVRHKHRPEISKYLKSDCEYLYEWVSEFTEEYGRKLTISGTAFEEIKKTGYEIGRTSKHFDSIFRNYYFGGRVQCFETGSFYGDFEYADINSSYPFAMLHEHPWGSDYVNLRHLPKDHGGYFAHITAISRGALPVRGLDNRLHFPNDDKPREYKVTGWEVQAGIDTGTLDIIEIHQVYKFNTRRNFRPFVEKFYEKKLEAQRNGKKSARQFSKLIMNSGYGRFAMDPLRFKDYEIHPYGEYPASHTDWEELATTDTLHTIFERPNPDDRFFNCATGASITGFGRAHLWRAICSSERPMYCDTDGLICAKFGGTIGDELGEWSYEGVDGQLSEAHIAQRKMYAARYKNPEDVSNPYKVAAKGVRITAEQIIRGINSKEDLIIEREAPAFSLRFGQRFLLRTVKFSEIENVA